MQRFEALAYVIWPQHTQKTGANIPQSLLQNVAHRWEETSFNTETVAKSFQIERAPGLSPAVFVQVKVEEGTQMHCEVKKF